MRLIIHPPPRLLGKQVDNTALRLSEERQEEALGVDAEALLEALVGEHTDAIRNRCISPLGGGREAGVLQRRRLRPQECVFLAPVTQCLWASPGKENWRRPATEWSQLVSSLEMRRKEILLLVNAPLPDPSVEQKDPRGCALLNAYQEGKPGRRKPHHLTTGAAAASVSPEAPLL